MMVTEEKRSTLAFSRPRFYSSGTATTLNGSGVLMKMDFPFTGGGLSGSSAQNVKFCSSATMSMKSSLRASCSPGHARRPAGPEEQNRRVQKMQKKPHIGSTKWPNMESSAPRVM